MGVSEGGVNVGRVPSRPTGLQRILLRLPVYFYRLRLGWVFGRRFLLLRHRGRRSGRVHSTVLEVIRHDRSTDESVVVSAWGEKADWYRNIRVNPPIEVQTALEKFVPVVRFLEPEEGYTELLDYERRHPGAARVLLGLVGLAYDQSEEGRRRLASTLPLVSFRPETRSEKETGHSQ